MHPSSSGLYHQTGLPRGAGKNVADCLMTAPRGVSVAVSRRNAGSPTTGLLDLEHARLRLGGHWVEKSVLSVRYHHHKWPSLRCPRLPRTRSTRRVIREPRHRQLKVSGPPSSILRDTGCIDDIGILYYVHRYMLSGLAGKVVYQNCGTTSRCLGTVHAQPSFRPSSRLATKATTSPAGH
jgi:hypothetical protein